MIPYCFRTSYSRLTHTSRPNPNVSQTMVGKTLSIMVVPLVLAFFVGLFCLLWKALVPNVGQGEYVRAMSFGGIVIYSAVIQKLV